MKKLITIFMLFISSALFASYDDALKLYQDKKYADSLALVAKDLVGADDFKQGSPNYNLRLLAAHNYWKLGNEKNSSAHFKKCIEIDKNNPTAYIDLSLMYIEFKKFGDAEATANRGLTFTKDGMLYYILGIVSMNSKNYLRAKELFEKANSVNPELYISYNALGITLMNLQKYGEANTAFSVALALNSDSPEIINNMGMSYEKNGKKSEAAEYYKKALSLDSGNETIKANLKRAESGK
jgi:tetratricopeptide (TPR) repeat protein